jgi:transposase
MADARMPEKVYELAVPMLPGERDPGPEGGRRPIGHYRVLKVIWFVLVTGCRWKDDRGRKDPLVWVPPPSEPDRRVSRIRLSG